MSDEVLPIACEDTSCVYQSALAYSLGRAVAQDYEKAAYYFRRAIQKNGDFNAYLQLRKLVSEGKCAAAQIEVDFFHSYCAEQHRLRAQH
jgi:TPR repeat protein